MESRFNVGIPFVIAAMLALTSCTTAPASKIITATHLAEDNPPIQQSSAETAASDLVYRNALPGTWLYQSNSIERTENVFYADGRFESYSVVPTMRGAKEDWSKGTWKIDNGKLIADSHDQKNSKNASIHRTNTSRIVSLREDELTLVSPRGAKLVLRKMPPVDPLLQKFAVKSMLSEKTSLTTAAVLRDFDRANEQIPSTNSQAKQATAAIRSYLAAAFAPERLQESMLLELGARLTPDEVLQALAWYESPLGMKCLKLFMDASLPDSEAERDAYLANLRKNPAQPERLAIIQEVDRSCKITESEVTSMLSMQLALAIGSMALLPPEQRIPMEKMAEDVERMRPKLLVMMEPVVVGRRLYALRSLSIAELREYRGSKISDIGRKFDEVSAIAARKSLVDATDRYLQSIKWAIESEKRGKGKVSDT
ncbi:MAG: hypothetical protein AAGU11_11620 [Syntrophobacteraceae bacterium]